MVKWLWLIFEFDNDQLVIGFGRSIDFEQESACFVKDYVREKKRPVVNESFDKLTIIRLNIDGKRPRIGADTVPIDAPEVGFYANGNYLRIELIGNCFDDIFHQKRLIFFFNAHFK